MFPKTISMTLTAVPQSSGNFVEAPVVHGAFGMPGIEDGFDRAIQLRVHVLRKLFAVLAHDGFETIDERLPRCCVDFGVGPNAERVRAASISSSKRSFRCRARRLKTS